MTDDDATRRHSTSSFVLGVLTAIELLEPGERVPQTRSEIRAFMGRAQSHVVAEDPELRGILDGDLTMLDNRG